MQNGILPPLIKNIKTNFSFYAFVLVFLLCAANFFSFIWNNTTNILYWDQWDTVNEVVNENDLTKLLFFQHNEHKMGLGLIVTKILASITSWSNQAETLFTGVVIFISAVLAVLIKGRIFGKIEIYDVFIPILFFNLYQWENLIWGFQISFVLPLLMLFLSVYLYTFKASFSRNFFLILISVLSAFTHFHGLIVVFLNTLFFIIAFITTLKRNERKRNIIGAVATSLIGIFYFFRFEVPQNVPGVNESFFISIAKRGVYIVLELNQLLGLRIAENFGFHSLLRLGLLLILPSIAAICFFVVVKKSWDEKKLIRYFPILSLFIFTFIFCSLTAFGRSAFGLSQAFSSRYATFIIPAYLGFCFSLYILAKNGFRQNLLILVSFIFLIVSSYNYLPILSTSQLQNENLSAWKFCYIKTSEIISCSNSVKFRLHPAMETTEFESKLNLLEKNRLNLFFHE